MNKSNVEFLRLSMGECRCMLPTCPTVIAQHKLASLHPREAVLEAGKENPMSPFILKLAQATLVDKRYRRSGATTMFIYHILHGRATYDGNAHWDYAIVGLINIFASIIETCSEPEDALIQQQLYEAYPAIIEVLSKDFDSLTGTGMRTDNRRALTCSLIGCFVNDPMMKRTMYNENTLKILLHCWLYTSLSHPCRLMVVALIEPMFGSMTTTPPCRCEKPLSYIATACKYFDGSQIVCQVSSMLKNRKLLGTHLEKELGVMGLFLQSTVPVFKPLIAGKVHKQIVLALRRQLAHPDSPGTEEVARTVGSLLLNMAWETDDKMELIIDFFENPCFAEVGVAAYKMANKTESDTPEPWYEVFEMVHHSLICPRDGTCAYSSTPTFVKAAKASLERLGAQTLMTLADNFEPGDKYSVIWEEILTILDISPESIRERYRRDKKCCNPDCPARKSGVRREKKRVCIACYAAWYCDSVCQKSDWKTTHKAECRRFTTEVLHINL